MSKPRPVKELMTDLLRRAAEELAYFAEHGKLRK